MYVCRQIQFTIKLQALLLSTRASNVAATREKVERAEMYILSLYEAISNILLCRVQPCIILLEDTFVCISRNIITSPFLACLCRDVAWRTDISA